MNRRDKLILGAAIAVILAATAYGVVRMQSIRSLTGAVLRNDSSPANQGAIQNAEIRVDDNVAEGDAKSDSTGYFRVNLHPSVRRGETITLHVRHPNYRPQDFTAVAGDRLYLIRMSPVSAITAPSSGVPVEVSDVRLRYAMKSQMTANIRSVVKVFEVPNTGNVPCHARGPCSPDRKWKAAIGGASLDAGDDNQFQGARVHCIGGPCPFTSIEKDSYSRGGRQISVLVRNWSDAASFVIEAEVTHTMTSDLILQSYPVIFNQTASFTLPAKAQGPSIDATIDHQEIVYPLGPSLKLSWADCSVQTGKDLAKLYQCVLKPGYEFSSKNE